MKQMVLLVILHMGLYAQYATYSYSSELCDCVARFDTRKYSRTGLDNTYKYLWWGGFNLQTDITVDDPGFADTLNAGQFEAECQFKKEQLQSLEIVDHPYWQTVKEDKIRELEQLSELGLVTIAAYRNPEKLLAYKRVDSLAVYYRTALIKGGWDLLAAWHQLNEEQKSKNADPQRLQRIFDERYNSSMALAYARVEVMLFGWWNRTNALLERAEDSYDHKAKFEALFLSRKCDCDEP
jgi:hypothetical protein